MQCSIAPHRDLNCGNIKTKMVNQYKNPYQKETDYNNIVDQLCTRLQDIKDSKESSQAGMHIHTLEQTEAVRRYCAAFPSLNKAEEIPLQYFLPPPAWCPKKAQNKVKMQRDLSMSNDYNIKKKFPSGKDRRNSYNNPKKGNKKRCHNYSRSFESKENLPEWVTHEGVWDMESQDPVKEFIRAIALDEGYGTCENTVTDDIREIAEVNAKMNAKVPNWDDSLDFEADWVIKDDLKPQIRTPAEEELYAKFEAKFDRSIEALWSKEQANTPDDEYQDLPIDFQDLLSSPSDNLFYDPSAEKCSMISLSESIWSNDAYDACLRITNVVESPTKSVEGLHDRFKPLNLADDTVFERSQSPVREPFSLYSYEGIYEAVPSVADMMRSLTAINHSAKHSSFTEVIPRRPAERIKFGDVLQIPPTAPLSPPDPLPPGEDLLTSSRTHFRPIRKDSSEEPVVQYTDGVEFDIRGELDAVTYRLSESGYMYLDSEIECPKRYLEYRTRSIHYGRLNLTEAQRKGNDMEDNEFRLKFAIKQNECGVQTDPEEVKVETVVEVKKEPEIRAVWPCEECGYDTAKKMRSGDIASIWSSEVGGCGQCASGPVVSTATDELSLDWEELLCDIAAAHAQYATEATDSAMDRKRRHSAALRCVPNRQRSDHCTHPHAPFLHCLGSERPLTR